VPAPPLALYVHLPWCIRKCPYCDFNSHVSTNALPERDYVAALLADLDHEVAAAAGRTLASIFIGGGTPSLFSPESVFELLEGVRARFALASGCEITLEANPGASEAARFAGYRAAGVNRLSVGAQSFHDGLLARIGRVHDAADARRALEAAAQAGFHDVNVDLMYALPDQTVAEAEADVAAALALAPTHISHYQLTLEPGTAFARRPPALPAEDAVWAMQTRCQARLAEAGFRQYEVSAYARSGRRCAHNLNYWGFGDYIGIGAGAHGKLGDPVRGEVRRRHKHAAPRRYLAGLEGRSGGAGFVAAEWRVAPREAAFEFLLNALRLTEGFTAALFEARTGLPLSAVGTALAEARERGLLEHRDGRVRATALGRCFLDDLVALFLPEPEPAPGLRAP